MKCGKTIILAFSLSLLLIGAVNASVITDESQTNGDLIQMGETNATASINLNSDSQINENQDNSGVDENCVLETGNGDEEFSLSASNPITVNGYDQLYDQITKIKNEGTSKSYIINLNPKGDFTITTDLIWGDGKSQARELTINGNGVTVDGKGSKSFLTVSSNYALTINNLNIVNNYRFNDGGGAIYVASDGELHVNSCNFTNCRTPNVDENVHGGAIRGGFDARIYIDNSIFKKNYATYGGGAVVIGATFSEATLNPDSDVDASKIVPTLFINNSQFIENSAGHGGAVNVEDYCAARITNCIFKGNSAFDSEDGLGGGICTDEISYLVSINNTFQENTAIESGAGIYNAPYSPLIVENNIFIKNQAPYGAALCNLGDSTLTIKDSTFIENKANDNGAAIHNTNNAIISITNSTFDKNTATTGGAISILYNNKITVTDCAFNSNTANNFGGALHIGENNDMIMKNTKLISNMATANGGAAYIGKNTNLTANNVRFNTNKASVGGAICVDDDSKFTIEKSFFVKNNATKNGGAIYITKNNNVEIIHVELTGNVATANGGAICIVEGISLTLNNTNFDANKASIGGALSSDSNSKILIDDSIFTKNSATKSGGAIYSSKNNHILIGDTDLSENAATANGGAICIVDGSILTATNVNFNANKAKTGGAVSGDANSVISAEDSIFSGNDAGQNGGAIYSTKNSKVLIKSTDLTGNVATANGGAICVVDNTTITSIHAVLNTNKASIGGALSSDLNSKITLNKSEVSGNNATKNGGAIYSTKNNTVVIKDTDLIGNMATLNGGAICILENSAITVTNVKFNANKAKTGGAVSGDANSVISAEDSIFSGNDAGQNGGAVYLGKNSNITTNNTTFSKNTANNLGGAICIVEHCIIKVSDDLFVQNNAISHGGAIYSSANNNLFMRNAKITDNGGQNGGALYLGRNSNIAATNTTFSKNTASNQGGAICGGSESGIVLINSELNNNVANSGKAIYSPQDGILTLKGNNQLNLDDCRIIGEMKNEYVIGTKISIDSIKYYSDLTIGGKLVDEYDFPIPDETVFVTLENNEVVVKTNDDGKFIARYTNIAPGTYVITASYVNRNSVYDHATTTITKKIVSRQPTSIIVSDITTTYGVDKDVVVVLKDIQNNPLVNAALSVDLGDGVKDYVTDAGGQVKISTNGLAAKSYDAKITFNGNENYSESNTTSKISINKESTKITATGVTTTYGVDKDVIVVLKDIQNNPLVNAALSVDLGDGVKDYVTDAGGQVKISTNGLAAKSYDAKITFNGNENYSESNTAIKIIINKQSTKITVSDVTTTFRADNYLVIVLKDNQNNPVANGQIEIDIGGVANNYITDKHGQVKMSTKTLSANSYDAKITFQGNTNYIGSMSTVKITVNKESTKIIASNLATTHGADKDLVVTLKTTHDTPLTNTQIVADWGEGAKGYITDYMGQIKISTKNLTADSYNVKLTFDGGENYVGSNTVAKITFNKQSLTIIATDLSVTYNDAKYLVITLKDNLNLPLSNAQIFVDLGTGFKEYNTNNNGQVNIPTKGLSVKSYDVKINFNGNEKYSSSTKTVKVTVKKATVKLTAKAKTFKKSVKTKKYTVTLKNNKQKVMKNTWVTLKVNKKTYKVKTNNKGQATFKITNLKKKGKFVAVVKYAGSKYYSSKTVKPKITVK